MLTARAVAQAKEVIRGADTSGGGKIDRDEFFTFRPGRRGRSSAISLSLYKSVLYGAFVWARRALKHRNRRFAARAVMANKTHDELGSFRVGDRLVL